MNVDLDRIQFTKNTTACTGAKDLNTANTLSRIELLKDKYDIDAKTYNRESEKGYFQALDYLINQLTPSLTAMITTKNGETGEIGRKVEKPRTSATGMKSLVRNLAAFQKECCTEVCILESLYTSKKKVSESEILTETKVKVQMQVQPPARKKENLQ